MTPVPRPPARPAAVAAGAFALWQLVFIPASNLVDFIPRRASPADVDPVMDYVQKRGTFTAVEPLQRAAEVVGTAFDLWGEASGQEQGWQLFSDGNPPHSLFPVVELTYADGVVVIPSRFEPADLARPRPRPPLVNNRLYNFQAQFTNPGYFCSAESLARHGEIWSAGLPVAVRDTRGPLIAWFRWHAATAGRGTPVEAVMSYRYIPTPMPDEPKSWAGPVLARPYARWRPAADALDAYDPVAGRFVTVWEGGR